MSEGIDQATLRALLEWQLEMGADAPVGDAPVDRFALPERAPWSGRAAAPAPALAQASAQARARERPSAAPAAPAEDDPVLAARRAAEAAEDLEALRAAIAAYPHCELKKGARHTVFADGRPGARVMVIGEAPGREEDREGLPFVGRAGQLLDRMFAAIGLSRAAPDPEAALYITNILPWRPPENRRPTAEECAMLAPFVARHVELAAPELLVLMGNTPAQALLGAAGITRLRGTWREVLGRPAMPTFHPAYLLRQPAQKRLAWADLLELAARLDGGGQA